MMKTKPSRALLGAAVLLLAGVPSLRGQSSNRWFVDFETGGVFPGYNDVRIPGDSGTRFSLTDDLASESTLFIRIRAGFRFHPRHTLTVLFAPLSISGAGSLGFPLHYNGLHFPAGTPLDANYKFNSYRLSWRYGIRESERWRIGLGLTAKIRDAHIEISGGGQTTRNSNVGGVPLLNFLLEWRFSPLLRVLFEGDAAAAPQGRAEDVQLALVYQKSDSWSVRLGYRILEGGADNDKVYSFALFNYLLIGVTGHF